MTDQHAPDPRGARRARIQLTFHQVGDQLGHPRPSRPQPPRPQPTGAHSDWGWARQGHQAVGGCLTFTRSASPEQVIRAFGMDPATAQMLSEEDALAANPVGGPPWIRAGKTGDWAFAIEPLSQMGWFEDVGLRLSTETDAVVVAWTAKPTYDVVYLLDGVVVTHFSPSRALDRDGTEPDRFLPQMRQAGMETELPGTPGLPAGRRRRLRDPVIASLDMLTLALGIRLPEDVALGPLLTAQRHSS